MLMPEQPGELLRTRTGSLNKPNEEHDRYTDKRHQQGDGEPDVPLATFCPLDSFLELIL
jgi:hypothetical protein